MLEIPPPTVNSETPLRALRRILNYFEYVLVEKDGFIYGILVRQDLMKLLGKL
jgi:predicted transcriptional regulator